MFIWSKRSRKERTTVSRRESQEFNETETVTSRRQSQRRFRTSGFSDTSQDLRQGRFPSRLILTQFLHKQDCRETSITSPFSLRSLGTLFSPPSWSVAQEVGRKRTREFPRSGGSYKSKKSCDLFARGSDAVNAQVGSFFFNWLRLPKAFEFSYKILPRCSWRIAQRLEKKFRLAVRCDEAWNWISVLGKVFSLIER